MAGTRLKMLPAENTTWGAWKRAHPHTLVLSGGTGYAWNYQKDPYAKLRFPRRPALLAAAGEVKKIYPFFELEKSRGVVADRLGGQAVKIIYNRESQSARAEGKDVVWFVAFYDDLEDFYPGAEVYRGSP